MIQSLSLEAFYADAPTPADALQVAEGLLARLELGGPRIRATPTAAGPHPGRPWALGMALDLSHPALPTRPHDASLTYYPAGKTSPGGFALSAPAFESSGTDAGMLAETFSSLAAAWVAILPPDTLVVQGTPGQPEAKAFRVEGFPTQLGWLTWLSRARWPLAGRALGISVAGARVWEAGGGIWIQASPRLGDPPDPALGPALAAAVDQPVVVRTGDAGANRRGPRSSTGVPGGQTESRAPGPPFQLLIATTTARGRGLSLLRLPDWCPGSKLDVQDGDALAALATLRIGAALIFPMLVSLGVAASALPDALHVERAFARLLPPDDLDLETADAAAAWLLVERGPSPQSLLFVGPEHMDVLRTTGRELLARREIDSVATMLAAVHAPGAAIALLESLVAAPKGAALLGWASDTDGASGAPGAARQVEGSTSAPTASLSVSHEGILLGSGRELDRAIVELLAGRTATFGRDDRHPHDWLVRAWQAWGPTTPQAAEIARGTAAALASSESAVVAGAIWFFQLLPDAPDRGALGRALLRAGEVLAGTPDPLGESPLSVRGELGRAVVCNENRASDPLVLAAVRDLALVSGDGVAVIAGLFDLDRTFLEKRVADIVRANPSALSTLVSNVAARGQDPTNFLRGGVEALGVEAVRGVLLTTFAHNPALRDSYVARTLNAP